MNQLGVDPDTGLSLKAKRFVKTLSSAMEELDILQPTLPSSMVVGITCLQDDLLVSSNKLQQFQQIHQILNDEFNGMNEIKSKLLK